MRVSQLHLAAVLAHLREQRGILVGTAHRHHVTAVLGGAAQHRRAADVDEFDHGGEVHLARGVRAREGIEVHHHHVHERDLLAAHLLKILRPVAARQDAGVHARVQRLQASPEQAPEAGELARLLQPQPLAAHRLGGAAGGHEVDPELREAPREGRQAGLVPHAHERTTYWFAHGRHLTVGTPR